MKQLTFHGKGILEVPYHFRLKPGESREIDDELAAALERANPDIPMSITDLDADTGAPTTDSAGENADEESQPEVHEDEGQQPPDNTKEE